MQFIIFITFLFFNSMVFAETLFYKNVNTSNDSDYMKIEFPDECSEIIKINTDQSLEFKNKNTIEKKVAECKIFLKGKKVKDSLKSGSGKILESGVKVKEGLQKGIKEGTESFTNSVSKETNLFLEDTVKLKDGIVGGTSKIINGTLETGSKITSGAASFFKGIFSSKD